MSLSSSTFRRLQQVRNRWWMKSHLIELDQLHRIYWKHQWNQLSIIISCNWLNITFKFKYKLLFSFYFHHFLFFECCSFMFCCSSYFSYKQTFLKSLVLLQLQHTSDFVTVSVSTDAAPAETAADADDEAA